MPRKKLTTDPSAQPNVDPKGIDETRIAPAEQEQSVTEVAKSPRSRKRVPAKADTDAPAGSEPTLADVPKQDSSPEPKTPRRRRTKSEDTQLASVEVAELAVPEPASIEVAVEPKKGRRGGKSAPAVTAPAEETRAGLTAEASEPKKTATEPDQSPAEQPGGRRRRTRTKAETETAPTPTLDAEAELVDSPTQEPSQSDGELVSEGRRRRGRRGRGRKSPSIAEPDQVELAEGVVEISDEDLLEAGIVSLAWRPRVVKVAEAKPTQAAVESSDGGPVAPRKSRRRRRGPGDTDQVDAPVAAEKAEEVVKPEPSPAPAKRGRRSAEPATRRERPTRETMTEVEDKSKRMPTPPRPTVPTPIDAPQVILRNGVPVLARDKRVYPSVMFFGSSPDERRANIVLEEIKLASEAGVKLFSHLIELEVDAHAVGPAVSLAAYLLAKTLEIDPQAQVVFRVLFTAPPMWQERYPKARYRSASGDLAEPSVCDEQYWTVAQGCLEQFCQQLRMLDSRDSIMGLHLDRGEWFVSEASGYDVSEAAREEFREWVRMRYADDIVSLRAAWFDGAIRFDSIEIPSPSKAMGEPGQFIRFGRKERRWVDYHLFLSDITVKRIGDLAYAAKTASSGYFVVGVSYGYTFEWSHPYSGHLSLGKLLRTPEIDFVAGPPDYRSREPGGAAPLPCPIDSVVLNGKVYFSEEDFKTAIPTEKEPDDFNPVIKTPQALEAVHWRGAGAAFAHSAGVCWMDLWGNGWLKTANIWARAKKVLDIMARGSVIPPVEPDMAVFIDERSLAYLSDSRAFQMLVHSVREAALRSGISAGFYLLSDLAHRERFPESKLYLFLNAWDIRSDLRSAIKSRLQRDGKVLFWLYSAGLFDGGRDALERAREVTGVALRAQPFLSPAGSTVIRKHALTSAFPTRTIQGLEKIEPSYFAIPEDALVLGEYTQSGLPSFIVRDFVDPDREDGNWSSVFLGDPVVNTALIRALAQMAGAHVWNYHEDVVHARPPFLTVHCTGSGPRAITLPTKWSAYNLQEMQWAATEGAQLRYQAVDGSTQVFLVGTHDDIETILQASPDDLLTIDEMPIKADNTVSVDSYAFDVPIMRLDEWMEGWSSEDNADDLLLRPKMFEDDGQEDDPADVPTERTSGQRRRRRRPQRPRGSSSTIDELGMNVVFRKRE